MITWCLAALSGGYCNDGWEPSRCGTLLCTAPIALYVVVLVVVVVVYDLDLQAQADLPLIPIFSVDSTKVVVVVSRVS